MKVLLQRFSKAHVAIEKKIVEEISTGLLLLLGIENGDSQKDVDYLVSKISNLRLFSSAKSQFDRSVLDVKGEILIISQFTLCGDCNKGRRPDFTNAAPPAVAQELYNKFVQKFKDATLKTKQGRFGAMMDVSLVNDGPVTLMLESQ